MALRLSRRTRPSLRVANFQEGETTVGQLATVIGFFYEQSSTGVLSSILKVLVEPYALVNNELTTVLNNNIFKAYTKDLRGNNDTLCALDGSFLLQRERGEGDTAWEARVNEAAAEQDCMLQGDMFEEMRQTTPTIIGQMELHHLAAADAMGRFSQRGI